MIVEEKAVAKRTSISRFIANLGPKGLMALTAAIAVSWLLFSGNLGSGLFSGQSPGVVTETADERERAVKRLFDAIDGVVLEDVVISTQTVQEVTVSVFSNRAGAEREVVQSVVVMHRGNVLHPHEVTLAISNMLGVQYHNIQLLNLDHLGGN
ncbi:MAG: hypothetical protein FWF59_09415 [Turicibacter sp.]|nr:hypothetical protein [Turicibacter sp.]